VLLTCARMAEVYAIIRFLYALGVRVRMLRPLAGVFNRVRLSYFHPGLSYDVDPSLGHYLISQRAAEEFRDTGPMLIVPIDGTYIDDLFEVVHGGGVRVTPPERANDGGKSARGARRRKLAGA
jgi:hypothetical protein